MAEKFGGKWTLGFGLLLTSVTTAITPWAVTIGGATGLFIIRVIQGMGEVSLDVVKLAVSRVAVSLLHR